MSSIDDLCDNAKIVRPAYLEKASHQKDLIRRLRKLVTILHTDETIEANDVDEWPGLAAVAQVAAKLLRHKDKQVRLYSTLACLEIFGIYAPECPWDPATICRIFAHVIQQVGNLSHRTSAEGSAEFTLYTRILDLLADVKIGVVLTELALEQKDQVPEPIDNAIEDIHSLGSNETPSSHESSGGNSRGKTILEQNLLPDDYIEAPLPLLVRFFHTLLHSIRREHSRSVQSQFVQALSACLDEYHPTTIPVQVLDELLLCLAAGPTVLLTDPHAAKKARKGQPLPQIAVENPSYTAAAQLVQAHSSRLVTPVATLLSGLLQADPWTISQSKIAADPAWQGNDVWSVLRHVHRTCPTLLTSVWGTIRETLTSPDAEQRLAAVQLVGHMWQARPNTTVGHYGLLQVWWQRQHDVKPEIRQALLPACLSLVGHWASQTEALSTLPAQALDETTRVIEALVVSDASAAVRLAAVHAVCEVLYKGGKAWMLNSPTVARLLQAVGRRVSARQPSERQDALTGLVKLYEKHYLRPSLEPLQQQGDGENDNIEDVRHVLDAHCRGKPRKHRANPSPVRGNTSPIRQALFYETEEPYHWIPRALFCAFQFSDMRGRVVQLVDEGLLPKKSSNAARAVGVAILFDSLRENDSSNLLVDDSEPSAALRYLWQMLSAKALLQRQLEEYLEQRQKWKKSAKGTEEAMACEAQALELLHKVATFSDGPTELSALKGLHHARDEHIFRILRSLVTPLQSKPARSRAAEELPKRCSNLAPGIGTWMKQLVRRIGMGELLNADSVQASVELAQQCLEHGDVGACATLLTTVKVAAQTFPTLCGTPATFQVLQQLFSTCRATKQSSLKKDMDDWRLVTALSSILSKAAACRETGNETSEDSIEASKEFRADLMRLCTGEGTPTQARNAVYTLSRMETNTTTDATSPSANLMSRIVNKVASPLRYASDSEKQISILSALSALADCAPDALASHTRGKKALLYALEDVLMGRRRDEDEEFPSDDEHTKLKNKRNSPSQPNRHITPKSHNVLDDDTVSAPCRRLCAAVAFLVSHIRSTFLHHRPSSPKAQKALSKEQVMQVFKLLSQILKDKGLPPNDRDRNKCNSRQDRAALRQVSAIHLLRLCDPRLGLEKPCLTVAMWHTLGEAFLDEEKIVRECVMEEFSHLLRGTGVFGVEESKIQAQAPALRFVAYICLCIDGDSSHDSLAANAFASNTGKTASGVRSAASVCVTNLRMLCDAMYNTCRANGAETQFETVHKMRFMPEYMVPYAFHLLALRRETRGIVLVETSEDDNTSLEAKSPERLVTESEAKDKILAKRLKAIFDPLIHTLGEGADNISFLLRMTELLGRQFAPVPTTGAGRGSNQAVADLKSKLDKVLASARETLLSYVKKDVNLDDYPGTVQVPASLFKRWSKHGGFASADKVKKCESNKRSHSALMSASKATDNASSSKKNKGEPLITSTKETSHVHFSPDLKAPSTGKSHRSRKSLGINLSPISRMRSPFTSPLAESVHETQTLGSTPPFIATVQSTAPDPGTDIEEDSNMSSKPVESVMRSGLKMSLSSDLGSEDGMQSTSDNRFSTQSSHESSTIAPDSSSKNINKDGKERRRRSSRRGDSQSSMVDDPRAVETISDKHLSQETQDSTVVLSEDASKVRNTRQGMNRITRGSRSRPHNDSQSRSKKSVATALMKGKTVDENRSNESSDAKKRLAPSSSRARRVLRSRKA